MGRSYAGQDGDCRELQYFPLLNIEEVDRPACVYIASGCCDHEVPRLKCDAGMSYRANVGSCKDIKNDDCTSTEKVKVLGNDWAIIYSFVMLGW